MTVCGKEGWPQPQGKKETVQKEKSLNGEREKVRERERERAYFFEIVRERHEVIKSTTPQLRDVEGVDISVDSPLHVLVFSIPLRDRNHQKVRKSIRHLDGIVCEKREEKGEE